MRISYDGDGNWPFAFDAEQRITLFDDALWIDMAVTNRAGRAAPIAFSHHPYFDAAGAALRFAADTVWINRADMIPECGEVPMGQFDFASGAPVAGRAVDNCYTGWDGTALISWIDRPHMLAISASRSLPATVVYCPLGGDFFCFEPVAHLTNAINIGDCPAPMPFVAPGERFTASIRMQALPVPRHP